MRIPTGLKNNKVKMIEWLETEQQSIIISIRKKKLHLEEIETILSRVKGTSPPRL